VTISIKIFTAVTSIGDCCIFILFRHAKGPAIAEDLVLFALGLTQAPIQPFSWLGSSGICRVTLDFLATIFSLSCYWPTPGPANPSEPAIIRLEALITSGFEGFFAGFSEARLRQ